MYNFYTGAVAELTAEGVGVEAGYEGHVYAVVAPFIQTRHVIPQGRLNR